MKWLLKEEPTHYGDDAFVADKRTDWEGVRNPVAQKPLRAVKKGDASNRRAGKPDGSPASPALARGGATAARRTLAGPTSARGRPRS